MDLGAFGMLRVASNIFYSKKEIVFFPFSMFMCCQVSFELHFNLRNKLGRRNMSRVGTEISNVEF